MVSRTHNQGTSMSPSPAPPTTTPEFVPRPQPADFKGAITRLASPAASLNMNHILIHSIALGNAALLLSFIWALLHPSSSMGLLELVKEDLGLSRNIVLSLYGALFVADIAYLAGGIQPGYNGFHGLYGMGAMATTALIYTIAGETGFVRFAAFGGIFVLSALGIATVAQNMSPRNDHPRAKRYIIPAISWILLCYAVGLITRPESPLSQFITDRVHLGFFVIVIVWLLIGHGYLRRDRVSIGAMAAFTFGQYLVTLMLIGLFISGEDFSVISLVAHVFLSVLLICFTYMQPDIAAEGRAE